MDAKLMKAHQLEPTDESVFLGPDKDRRLIFEAGKHIPCLDGVRGLAILIVTLYRFGKEGFEGDSARNFALNVLEVGETGVDLFFVLSGFLITGVLLDSKESPRYFGRFYQRRSLRIFPLYFASLAIFLLVVPFLSGTNPFPLAYRNQFYLWTYLGNVKMSLDNTWCFGRLDHFWSLAVEEHFYLAWPLIVYCFSPRRLLTICILLGVASAVSRIAFTFAYDNDAASHVFTLFRLDGLLAGAAIAILVRCEESYAVLRSWCLRLLPILLFFSLALILSGRTLLTIRFSLVALAYASGLTLLVTSREGSLEVRFFETQIMRTLGKYSYAMYIFQSPIIPLVASYVSVAKVASLGVDVFTATAIYTTSMFALTFILAILSWNLLEVHFLRLRR